jgi:DNA-binding MarR family transcriptional regulator
MTVHDSLPYMLHKLGAMMEYRSDALLFEQFGLGFSQFKILMALSSSECAQQKDIAAFLGQTEASISRQIKLLKQSGRISSSKNEDNKKINVIALTARGKKLSDDSVAALEKLYTPLSADMNDMELKAFMSDLSSVYNKLEPMCE